MSDKLGRLEYLAMGLESDDILVPGHSIRVDAAALLRTLAPVLAKCEGVLVRIQNEGDVHSNSLATTALAALAALAALREVGNG